MKKYYLESRRLLKEDKRGIEMIGRRGRRRRKLLDDLKERRGYSHLKAEALDRTMWSLLWKRLWICCKTDY